jgi:cytochrome P450
MTTHENTIRLGDPEFWKFCDVDETFRQLRRDHPVSWTEDHNSEDYRGGYWSLVRHEDIRNVSRNADVFVSRFGVNNRREDEPEIGMLSMDDPEHRQLRSIVTGRFSAKGVRSAHSRIEHSVDAILDRCFELKDFDFVSEAATVLPTNLILDLVDCPDEVRPEVVRLTVEVFSSDPNVSAAADRQIAEIGEVLGEQRRGRAGDDLLTLIANAHAGDRPLESHEIGHYFGLLVTAGIETTGTVMAQSMVALEANPNQRDRWRAEFETLRASAIEELVRWTTPVRRFSRMAIVETEIAGQPIAAEDIVCLWYTSANRDECVFADPNTLDLSRHPNPHLAFGGGGPHFCLGANLARLELGIFFEHLFTRCSHIEVGEPEYSQNSIVNNLDRLPCRLVAQ